MREYLKDAINKDHRNHPDSNNWDTINSGTDTDSIGEGEMQFVYNVLFSSYSGIADNIIGAYLAVAKFIFYISL